MFLFKQLKKLITKKILKIYITICFYLNFRNIGDYYKTQEIHLHYSMFLFKPKTIKIPVITTKFTLQYVPI